MILNYYTVFIEDIAGNQIKYQLKDWNKACSLLHICSKEKPYKQAIIKQDDEIIISLKTI